MIRRDANPNEWVVIRQVDHAHISEKLATDWNDAYLTEPGRDCSKQERQVVLASIRRHDDGWAEFDSIPRAHPQTNAPLHFTERTTTEAHAIWVACIESTVDLEPLGSLMVAEHFVSFRRGSERPDYREFVDCFDPRCQAWRAAYLDSGASEVQLQERLTRIPFFDDFSLRLCCTPFGPFRVSLAEDFDFLASPIGPDGFAWSIDPWPFLTDCLHLSIPAARIRKSPNWVLSAENEPEIWSETLEWELRPT
jgi:hypothetical protein